VAANAEGLRWEHQAEERGQLLHPVLVAAFEGWNDAADAASNAASWLTQHGTTVRIATIDPEANIDFQARRPQVELIGGVTRHVTWPSNDFFRVHIENRDLVVLRGIEPNYQWRSFCRTVLAVATETKCSMVVTFGALLADVPHSRKARITGTATDPELIARLGLNRSRYEGPTGIVGVLHDMCRLSGVSSASLWAPVPHYIASPPNPAATLALLERFSALLELPLDLQRLEATAAAWRTKVDEVAAGDDDVRTYVEQLQERFDADDDSDPGTHAGPDELTWKDRLPSGDELARELEEFLRDERPDE